MKYYFLLVLFLFVACDDDTGSDGPDPLSFDRNAMLRSWTDDVILPAYADFLDKSESLVASARVFQSAPGSSSLNNLLGDYTATYRAWQRIDLFQIGPAETIGLREYVNTYPVNVSGIESNLATDDYNLELSSQRDRQGLAALDYLIYGMAETSTDYLARVDEHPRITEYIVELTERIDSLATWVHQEWIDSYREEFIANDQGGATASTDRFVNNFVFYYEKFLRAGKVGIPAGVFSGNPLPGHVEAPYNVTISKTLALDALQATQDFFNGLHTSGGRYGLADYLDYLNTVKDGTDLTTLINDQFEAARLTFNDISPDMKRQVQVDNTAMLAAYDALQRNVVLLKVDMMQALDVSVDYVDADGD